MAEIEASIIIGSAKKAIACVVTEEEHEKLHKEKCNKLTGWDWYEDARIKVFDTKNETLLNLN